jgi:hypothetical protein
MSFDLNINNYTKDELVDMLELPQNYNETDVEIKESQLREKIMNNKDLDKTSQLETVNFIIKAKNIILNSVNPSQTSFQKKIEDFYNSSYELKPTEIEDPSEHMVQVRKEKPYLSSYPSEFFPGIINPLKKRTIKKILNIDTRFRDNYFGSLSTNFNLVLPITFNDVLQMQLNSIELPMTFYSVSKQNGNNFFSINIIKNDGSVIGPGIIDIPTGNYDKNTIIEAINNQIQVLSVKTGEPAYSYIRFAIDLTYGTTGNGETLVGVSNITEFDVSYNSFELDFQADRYGQPDRNTPLPLKFGWIMGFRNGIYTNNINYVSEGIIDIIGPRYFFLAIDDHNNNVNNSFYSAFNSSILNKNILARISLQAHSFNVLEQNNLNIVTYPREYFGPVNLLNMNIQLLDEYGRVVDINNMDYSFCLTLTTVYDL